MRYVFFIAIGMFFSVVYVNAALDDVTYPIAELGNCESQEACFAYCDLSENYDACMAFAEAMEIIPADEIQEYRQMQEAVAQGGPGGCMSESECEAYCGDLTHIDECLSFAQEHGLMDDEELQEAQQVQAALDAGYTMPGGCTDEESCESYCADASHMQECISFGQAAGFISEQEATDAENFLKIMQSGGTPGDCQSQQECEEYCADGAHAQECLEFAVQEGFMTQEEADAAMESGMEPAEEIVGPGGCTDEESCRAYCEQESNQEECKEFFGDMGGEGEDEEEDEEEDEDDEDEDEQQQGSEDFVGPGGCVGEEACFVYCSDPVNQEVCASFFGEFPEEYPLEYEDQSEYQDDGSDLTPSYQYEGRQNDDLYTNEEDGFYQYDEFESFDSEDVLLDLERSGEDEGSYNEIYIETPSDFGEQPSYDETIYGEQPNMSEQPSDDNDESGNSNESPSFLEPSVSDETGAPSDDSNSDESQSTANAGFVNSARELFGKVLRLLQI